MWPPWTASASASGSAPSAPSRATAAARPQFERLPIIGAWLPESASYDQAAAW